MTDQVDFRDLVARLGWKCPECGTVYAPSVTACAKPHAPGVPEARTLDAPAQEVASAPAAQKVLSSRILDTDYAKDPAFEEFWKQYPSTRDKARAYKEWRKQLAQVPEAQRKQLAQRIIAGAIAYCNDPNRDPTKTKYAEGWLSGNRWEDEIGTVAAPTLASVKTQEQIDAEWERQRAEDDAAIRRLDSA